MGKTSKTSHEDPGTEFERLTASDQAAVLSYCRMRTSEKVRDRSGSILLGACVELTLKDHGSQYALDQRLRPWCLVVPTISPPQSLGLDLFQLSQHGRDCAFNNLHPVEGPYQQEIKKWRKLYINPDFDMDSDG